MSAPSMTLFHNPASPFVRKVRVLLAETGQQGRVALHTRVLSGKVQTRRNKKQEKAVALA
jgi:glutathione S-transferase